MPQKPEQRQESFWHSIVVPSAVGVEAFFWRLAWFGLLLALIVGGCLQQRPNSLRDQVAASPRPAS